METVLRAIFGWVDLRRNYLGVWLILTTTDGGGVRGYSTLLILKALMNTIARLEIEHPPSAPSSFHPLHFQNGRTDSELNGLSVAASTTRPSDTSRYLPCHYFGMYSSAIAIQMTDSSADYVAGTSTGGYVLCPSSRELYSPMIGSSRSCSVDCA